jgi:hypothetical protein
MRQRSFNSSRENPELRRIDHQQQNQTRLADSRPAT